MAFTSEQQQAIAARVRERAPEPRCPMCGTNSWIVGQGLVVTTLQEKPDTIALGGAALPSVPLVCRRCGNTVLLNAFVLGLGDILGIAQGDKPKEAEAEEAEKA